MSSQKIKFGDKEVDKKKFCSSKEAINILIMVEKICHLLQMIKKFMRNMMEYRM